MLPRERPIPAEPAPHSAQQGAQGRPYTPPRFVPAPEYRDMLTEQQRVACTGAFTMYPGDWSEHGQAVTDRAREQFHEATSMPAPWEEEDQENANDTSNRD